MLDKWLHKIIKLNKVAGVEVNLAGEDSKFNLVLLGLDKDNLKVEAHHTGISNLEALKELIPDGMPVSIAFTGKGILHKIVEDLGDDRQGMVEAALLNAKAVDFFMQQQDATEGQQLISIVRHTVMDEWIERFETTGLTVIDVNLGPFRLTSIRPLIDPEGDQDTYQWVVEGHSLSITQGQINAYYKQGEPHATQQVKVGEEMLPSDALIAFSSGFHLMLSAGEQVLDLPGSTLAVREEWQQQKLFKLLGWSLLGFFLTLLLVNFLVFGQLDKHNGELSDLVGLGKNQVEQIASLKKQIKDQSFFLTKTGWLEPSKTSFYSDQIAAIVPAKIKLTQLWVNPMEQQAAFQQKELLFTTKKVTLAGNCKQVSYLNEWIKDLRQYEWIADIKNVNFERNNRIGIGEFTFEIIIK